MSIREQVSRELNSTELGKKIWNLRIPILSIIGAVVIFILSFAIGAYQKEQAYKKYSGTAYQFIQKEFKELQEKKIAGEQFIIKFQALAEETGDYEGLAPIVLTSSDELVKQGKFKEARSVLDYGLKEFLGENVYLDTFLLSRLAVVNENLGEFKSAIEALEKQTKLSQRFLEGKIYLDLGRLYAKIGDTEKAQASFKFVVDESKDAEFSKIAKIYMEDLKGKKN